jgi:hypothetical protein
MTSELINSYLATDLTIELPSGTYLFTELPHVDALVEPPSEFATNTWFVITAWNPRSKPDLPQANEKNQADLRGTLIDFGYAVFDAYGAESNPASTYGEPMLAVYLEEDDWDDLDEDIANLAIVFEQNAYFKIEGDLVHLMPGLLPEALGSRKKNIVKLDKQKGTNV